jgi:hypothetical protein|tara:strand:- start:752 stop:3718 length:2967 start_codon:yes stop_codon:yes gene_type:complete
MSGSVDTLRTALGAARTIKDRTSAEEDRVLGDKYMDTPAYTSATDLEVVPAYSIHYETHEKRGSFIWHIVANEARQINRGASLLVPSYQIPLRFTGNRWNFGDDYLYVKNDLHWKVLFLGGSFGEDSYESIYNELIFSDHSHTRYSPYTQAEVHTWPTKTATNVINITPVYRFCLPRYQQYTENLSERLIPSIYPLLLHYSDNSEFPWSTGGSLDQETVFQKTPGWMIDYLSLDNKIPEVDVRVLLDGIPIETDGAGNRPPLLTITPTDPEYSVVMDSSDDPLSSLYTYLNESFPYNPVTSSVANVVDERYKNIYFGLKANDLTGYDALNLLPSYKFPYYVQFNIPKIQAGFFEQSIEYHDFDIKFLNTLKEVFTGETGETLNIKERNFVVDEKSERWIPTGHNKAEKFEQNQIFDQSVREVDYLQMLAYSHNNYFSVSTAGTEHPNSCVWGPLGNSEKAIYDKTGQYRYMNTSNSLGVINDVLNYVTTDNYFGLGNAGGVLERLYNKRDQAWASSYEMDILDITLDAWSDAWYTVSSVGDYQPHANLVSSEGDQYSECLAYRIEKKALNSDETIQNFWFFNSPWLGHQMSTGPDSMHFSGYSGPETEGGATFDFADTQVKYNKGYSYTVYSYVLVVGTKWKYSDLRLSRIIATLDDTGDGDTDRWCLELYDPNTDRAVPTIFQTTDELLDNNEFATDAQLTHDQPYIAEAYLNYEPSIKLLEIPLVDKVVTIQDHPPNKIHVSPFQKLDSSQTIGFHLSYENYVDNLRYPTAIDSEDSVYRAAYYESRGLQEVDPSLEEVVRQCAQGAQYIDVFRRSVKPSKISDFDGHLLTTISLKIPDTKDNYTSTYFHDTINTNRKYYYLFRATNDNESKGHLSEIYEAELVNDGGYLYSIFNVIFEEDLAEDVFTNTSKGMKKLIQLQPNLSHLTLDVENVDFSQTAESQLDNVKIGIGPKDSIWNKTFKVRLTSKKTGRKLDFNITYKLERE